MTQNEAADSNQAPPSSNRPAAIPASASRWSRRFEATGDPGHAGQHEHGAGEPPVLIWGGAGADRWMGKHEGSIREAERIVAQHPSYFMPDQFSNPANPTIHRKTTAIGNLGRLGRARSTPSSRGSGRAGPSPAAGKSSRNANPHIQIVAVEPSGSPVLSGGDSRSTQDSGHRCGVHSRRS